MTRLSASENPNEWQRERKRGEIYKLLLLLGESVTCCMCENDDLDFNADSSSSPASVWRRDVGAVACVRVHFYCFSPLAVYRRLFVGVCVCVPARYIFHHAFVPCRRFEISSFLRQFKMCRSTCRLTYIFHSRIERKTVRHGRRASRTLRQVMTSRQDTGPNYHKIHSEIPMRMCNIYQLDVSARQAIELNNNTDDDFIIDSCAQ